MVNSMQKALIKKELNSVVKTKSFFTDYLLVPLIFAVVFPVGAVLMITLMDSSGEEFQQLMNTMMITLPSDSEDFAIISILINNIFPIFFLMIPPLIVTAMASSSFTGEKERRTLETLLYSPMSLREIFNGKVIAILLVGSLVTIISFLTMTVLVGLLVWFLLGELFIPGLIWLAVILLVSPAFAFLGIIVQVRISAKAQRSEEAYQKGGMLVLPLVLLIVGQFTGVLLMSTWMFVGLGVILGLAGWILMRVAFRSFTYEELLR